MATPAVINKHVAPGKLNWSERRVVPIFHSFPAERRRSGDEWGGEGERSSSVSLLSPRRRAAAPAYSHCSLFWGFLRILVFFMFLFLFGWKIARKCGGFRCVLSFVVIHSYRITDVAFLFGNKAPFLFYYVVLVLYLCRSTPIPLERNHDWSFDGEGVQIHRRQRSRSPFGICVFLICTTSCQIHTELVGAFGQKLRYPLQADDPPQADDHTFTVNLHCSCPQTEKVQTESQGVGRTRFNWCCLFFAPFHIQCHLGCARLLLFSLNA